MSGPQLKLGRPEVAAIIDERYAREPDGGRKRRLLAVKLVAHGAMTSAEIADLCGIARGHLFVWLKVVREQGLEALLERGQPGPQEGACRGIKAEVIAELKRKLEAHEFATAEQARRWLQKTHRVDRPYASVWNWLKKFGGVLRVPRPSHSHKKPGAEQEFQEALGEKLAALGLEAGSPVKVWVMDEARFGLHTELRRVWTLRGQRPVVKRQIKYQWDYLYGALSVMGGEAHFAHLPSVSLEWDEGYLRNLAATDAAASHVLIRDQAGFHLRDGDARLPRNVRIVDLPPYSPELNPCEQLWDILKDDLANKVFPTITQLRTGMRATLRRYWENSSAVLSLIGRAWMQIQLNASRKTHQSF
jgi:transposase